MLFLGLIFTSLGLTPPPCHHPRLFLCLVDSFPLLSARLCSALLGSALPYPRRRQEMFERRASSLRQQLSEPRARREARAALAAALDDAEAAAVQGRAHLEEARASLSESQRRHGDIEVSAIGK